MMRLATKVLIFFHWGHQPLLIGDFIPSQKYTCHWCGGAATAPTPTPAPTSLLRLLLILNSRSTKQPAGQPGKQPVNRATGRSAGPGKRPVNRATGRSAGQPGTRPVNWATGRSAGRPGNRPVKWASGRSNQPSA